MIENLRYRLSGMIGNVLEHYDHALFALLAPFIAPLFFNQQDPLMALILTYAMLPLGMLMRPVGSLFFGWIGDRYGRRQALFCSLSGMAIATVGIGCLPTYQQVGLLAPCLLAIGRMIQNFCAAGETIGGAIFVLEHTSANKRNLMSSIYDSSTIAGFLLASCLVTILNHTDNINHGWRYLYWIGGVTAIFGLFMRRKTQEGHEFVQSLSVPDVSLGQILNMHKGALLSIILVAGFSYTIYHITFTLMSGFLPFVTQLSSADVIEINSYLLIADMILLPCFGYLAMRVGKERIMYASALCAAFISIPLFCLVKEASLAMIIAIQFSLVLIGVSFSCTYHAWAMEQVLPQHRYTILAFGCSVGSQLIAAPCSASCLWLYQKLGWTIVPALYLTVTAGLASYCVYRLANGRRQLAAL